MVNDSSMIEKGSCALHRITSAQAFHGSHLGGSESGHGTHNKVCDDVRTTQTIHVVNL